MKKLLFLCLWLSCSIIVFSQSDKGTNHIDSLISANKLAVKFKVDSGVIERVHHKVYVRFFDIYMFDSLSKDLVSCEHRQDSLGLGIYMAFYYSSNKIIKIDYGLTKAAGDDGVQDLYQMDYYYEDRIMTDSIEYTSRPKKIKLLTPDELYEIGMNYLKRYNSELK
jgi:hypothetical protein